MLNLAKGYKIYEPERLNEEYEVTDDVTLMANVDVEKIKEVFQHFIVMHDEPLFFILELLVHTFGILVPFTILLFSYFIIPA